LLEINLTIVIQLINFFILMWLLKKFLYKPMLDYIDRRSDGIKLDLSEAKRMKSESVALKEEQDVLYQKARQKAGSIIRDARKQGEEERLRIVTEAHTEYSTILEEGRKTIDMELNKAQAQLEKNVVEIAVEIAEKVVERDIKAADHEKFITQAVKKLEKWQ